jgi:hypothetical protein
MQKSIEKTYRGESLRSKTFSLSTQMAPTSDDRSQNRLGEEDRQARNDRPRNQNPGRIRRQREDSPVAGLR